MAVAMKDMVRNINYHIACPYINKMAIGRRATMPSEVRQPFLPKIGAYTICTSLLDSRLLIWAGFGAQVRAWL